MLIDPKKEEFLNEQEGTPGPSTAVVPHLNDLPPPTFEESVADRPVNPELAHTDIFVPTGGEEPPPSFTPYEAEYFVSGSGSIVSHDPHLNADGEALYRFLLSHSQDHPKYILSIHGSHTETRYRTVNSTDHHGHNKTRTESYTETIIDFDFKIDISQHIAAGPVHWSIPDEEPAYRGKMYKEVDGIFAGEGVRLLDTESGGTGTGESRRKAKKQEKKSSKAWSEERRTRGLPPWVGPGTLSMNATSRNPDLDPFKSTVLKSSKTLREWADEYCASNKRLKEFTYEKVVYGWNIGALEAAVTAAIKSTYYSGTTEIKFNLSHSKIHVRANSRFARALSHTWVKVILWILLIYPFIWLYKRFSKRGGGKWEVCGGAYALKRWEPTEPSYLPPPNFHSVMENDGRIVQTDVGAARLIGMREGEWFQKWEGTIKRAVTGRHKSREIMVEPDDHPTSAAMLLDGYHRI